MGVPLRIGEAHHRAKITDHEVELMRELLAERRALIERMQAAGVGLAVIRQHLMAARLGYGSIAVKFEMSKSYVRAVDADRLRIYPGPR